MSNIPIAKISRDNIILAKIISSEDDLNSGINYEVSSPREMINQVASLEVVCESGITTDSEENPHNSLIAPYGENNQTQTFKIHFCCCVFLSWGIIFLWYTRHETFRENG